MLKKVIVASLVALILAGGGTAIYLNRETIFKDDQKIQLDQEKPVEIEKSEKITYQGQDGLTALEILKEQSEDVVTNGEGENAFVVSINGVTADSTKQQYWSFKVNGQMAESGVGSYITKDGDIIEMELATF